MGAWGYEPYHNDEAADFLGEACETLADRVEEAFQTEDLEDEINTVRAACFLLERLGYIYVWDINRLESQLQTGIRLLNEARDESYAEEWNEPEEYFAAIDRQIAALNERLNAFQKNAKDAPSANEADDEDDEEEDDDER